MSRRKKEGASSPDKPEATVGSEESRPTFSPAFLRRFLFFLPLGFGCVTLLLWTYNLWGYFAVVAPASQLMAAEDSSSLTQVGERLESPHIFAGYIPYDGFGKPRAEKRNEMVRRIMARGTDYGSGEVRYLIQGLAFYLPAFRELKIDGSTPVVPGDREVLASVLTRWANAVRMGLIFSVHLTLVTLLLAGLYVVYRRFNLFARL